MNTKSSIILAGLMAYSNAVRLHQQDFKAAAAEIIGQVDANGDGKVQFEEVPAEYAEHAAAFAEHGFDKNGNGAADADELEAFLKAAQAHKAGKEAPAATGDKFDEMAGQIVAAADANKDGKVQMDEVPAEYAEHAAYFAANGGDVDGDGAASAKELADFARANQHLMKLAQQSASEIIAAVDANGDGAIQMEEVPAEYAEYAQAFAEHGFDKNGNGAADLDELEAFIKAAQAHKAGKEAKEAPAAEGDEFDKVAAGIVSQVDANKDGKIQMDEVPAEYQEHAAYFAANGGDVDGDGAASAKELADFARANQHLLKLAQEDFAGAAAEIIATVDANGDGAIQMEEVPEEYAEYAQAFAEHGFDKNGNNAADADELEAFLKAAQAHKEGMDKTGGEDEFLTAAKDAIASVDANGDGAISMDEVPAEYAEHAAYFVASGGDKNGDGKADAEELADALRADHERIAAADEAIASADANGDGKIQLEEVPEEHAQVAEDFIAAGGDKNGDGAADKDEIVDYLRQKALTE